jgi:hypothetical protein
MKKYKKKYFKAIWKITPSGLRFLADIIEESNS